MRLRRKKAVDAGVTTQQSSAMMEPTSSQESVELFTAPTRKGGYQQVDLMDDQETEITSGSGLSDPGASGRTSEAESRKK
jgi:hypothetical protein